MVDKENTRNNLLPNLDAVKAKSAIFVNAKGIQGKFNYNILTC